jgi:hypothetical protein
MRFGLSDLDELPSLKEFEQLARAALGADEGIAPSEPELGITAESLDAAPARAIPSTEPDQSAHSSSVDSSNSTESETKQAEEKARAESASSKY